MDLGSGVVRVLAEAPFGRGGGAWSRNGTIVFAPSVSGPLYDVSDNGGPAVPVTGITRPKTEQRHIWPFFLPDGKHFLYSDSSGTLSAKGESVYVASLDRGAPKLIVSRIAENVAYASGYLIYGRDHALWAQRFDVSRLELRGPARSITSQEVDEERSFSHAEFSVSQNGVLIFQSLADSMARLSWFDASGKQLGQLGEGGYRDPVLSPDGRLLAVSSDDARNGKFFIRVYDLAQGISTRLTDGGSDFCPGWSHDGRTITYSSTDAQWQYLKNVAADASSPPQPLLKGGPMRLLDWSLHGQIVFSDFSTGSPVLKIYSAADRRAVRFGQGAEARFSPDGKWIAYVGPLTVPDSDGIFVAPFPGPGKRIRISSGSGAQPNWGHDGKRIFYITPDRKLMVVDFDPRKKSAGAPRLLFQTRITGPDFSGTQYAVSSDGRFLINSFPPNYSSPLTLIVNWTAELRNKDD